MWSPDLVTDASTLLLVITGTEFITNECQQYCRGLTTSLQEEAKDIVQAVSQIKALTLSLKQIRENVGSYHSRRFETVLKICNELGITPSMPRLCGRQHHRARIPASNPSEYFRRTITVPILDHLHSEPDKRFISQQKDCFSRSILGTIRLVNRSCNCVQCGDESGGAISYRLPKCGFSQ